MKLREVRLWDIITILYESAPKKSVLADYLEIDGSNVRKIIRSGESELGSRHYVKCRKKALIVDPDPEKEKKKKHPGVDNYTHAFNLIIKKDKADGTFRDALGKKGYTLESEECQLRDSELFKLCLKYLDEHYAQYDKYKNKIKFLNDVAQTFKAASVPFYEKSARYLLKTILHIEKVKEQNDYFSKSTVSYSGIIQEYDDNGDPEEGLKILSQLPTVKPTEAAKLSYEVKLLYFVGRQWDEDCWLKTLVKLQYELYIATLIQPALRLGEDIQSRMVDAVEEESQAAYIRSKITTAEIKLRAEKAQECADICEQILTDTKYLRTLINYPDLMASAIDNKIWGLVESKHPITTAMIDEIKRELIQISTVKYKKYFHSQDEWISNLNYTLGYLLFNCEKDNQENYKAAKGYFEEALKYVGSEEQRALILGAYAQCCSRLKEYKAAIQNIEENHALFQKIHGDYNSYTANAACNYARILSFAYRDEEYPEEYIEKAFQLGLESLKIHKQLFGLGSNRTKRSLDTLREIREIYLKKQDQEH